MIEQKRNRHKACDGYSRSLKSVLFGVLGFFLGVLGTPLGLASDPQLLLPLLGDGSGFVSEIILTNSSDKEESGTIAFKNSSGLPLLLGLNGSLTDSVDFVIRPGGLFKLRTDGRGELRSGYGLVYTESPAPLLFGSVVLGWSGMEVSVSSGKLGPRHHVAVESGPSLESAVALVNSLASPLSVELLLLDDQGRFLDRKVVTLKPKAQLTAFIKEILAVPGGSTTLA